MYPYLGHTLLIMSDSYSVLSYNKDGGVKIIRNVCIVELRKGCEDEVHTTHTRSRKAAAGLSYTGTITYLGFYKEDVGKAYFKKVGKGFRVY